jgi:hypothetical protein
VNDARFSKVVEHVLHLVAIVFVIGSGCFLIVGGFIGNAGDMCWIGTSSYAADDGAIISTRILTWIKWLIAGLSHLLILSSILIVMGLTAWTIYTQEKTMDQYRFQSSSIHLTRTRRPNSRVRQRRRKVKAVQTRTILYILVFVLTYGPTFACRILQAKLQEQVLATTTGDGYYYNQEEAQEGASSSTMSNHWFN